MTAVSLFTLRAPSPVPATAAPGEFSAERAFEHVRVIGRVAHPIGSKSEDEVRTYLLGQLAALGTAPAIYSDIGVWHHGGEISVGTPRNIVAKLPGIANSRAVMLVAHYDSVGHAPGAADDGAGVGAILETLRALRSGPSLKNDLIILFTDGEEAGLLGADAFAAHPEPALKDVGLVLNFEARGSRGPSLLFETSSGNTRLMKEVARSAPSPIASSLFYALYRLLPNDTDFTVFRGAGVTGLNFAFGEGLNSYHSPLDNPEHLSLASLQHHGTYALALSRYFGQVDLAQFDKHTGDAVFFDWLGTNLVVYPESWVWPSEIGAVVCLIAGVRLLFRRSKLSISRFLKAIAFVAAFLVGVTTIPSLIWWALTPVINRRMIGSDCPANSWLLTSMLMLTVSAAVLLFSWIRKKTSVQELFIAALTIFAVPSCALAAFIPSGSYLLFWPFLAGAFGVLVAELFNSGIEPRAQLLVGLAGTTAAILLFSPLVYLLYIFLTLQLIVVIVAAFLVSLTVLIALPLFNIAVNKGSVEATLLLACAVGSFVAGVSLSHRSKDYPRRDSLSYSFDAQDNTAGWVSRDHTLDSWTAQFFPGAHNLRKTMPDYLAGSTDPVWFSPASFVPLPPPVAELLFDATKGDRRTIRIRMRSQRSASTIRLVFASGVRGISAVIGDREIPLDLHSPAITWNIDGERAPELQAEITIQAASGGAFWIMDETPGIPGAPGRRPDDTAPASGSDQTLVCRKYSL